MLRVRSSPRRGLFRNNDLLINIRLKNYPPYPNIYSEPLDIKATVQMYCSKAGLLVFSVVTNVNVILNEVFFWNRTQKFLRTELFACVHTRVHIYVQQEATSSRCEGKYESRTLMLCSTHYLPPWALAARGAVTLTWPWLSYVFTVPLCLWMCCSRCHSDNMWIKLSLTHPLRKGIQVQARRATLLPGSLSVIKLIL